MDRLTQAIITLQYEVLDRYFYLSAWSILVYDYLLTLPLEVELIWFSKWSSVKVLVLLVRYLPFISPIIINLSLFVDFLRGGICRAMTILPSLMIILSVLLAEIILAIRTWAIWDRNPIVGALIAISLVTTIVSVSIVEANYFKHRVYGPKCTYAPTPDYRNVTWEPYSMMAVFESIVLALIMTSAVRSSRSGENGRLSKIIHRDGIMSYIYLLCITTALIVMNGFAPFALRNVLAATFQVMYSVLTVRIVFRIRKAARQSKKEEDLHTTLLSVVFEPGSEESCLP